MSFYTNTGNSAKVVLTLIFNSKNKTNEKVENAITTATAVATVTTEVIIKKQKQKYFIIIKKDQILNLKVFIFLY